MKGTWAVPVIVSILVIGLLYSSYTQTADADKPCLTVSCNDGNACTTDSCVLSFSGNPIKQHNHCEFTPKTLTPCDDGNSCTGTGTTIFTGVDRCIAGVCVGGTNVANGISCTDLNVCNGDETCQSGTCTAGTNVADGTSCVDGDLCNGDEICQSGTCTAGTQLDCNDDKACTDDSCVPASGCANDPVAVGTTCGNPGDGLCDLQDSCDGSGTCINEVVQDTVSCRAVDNNCDAEEFCDGLGSCPADALAPEGTFCGDTVVVGVNQNCDGAGTCVLSSAITCGEGTELEDGVCVANICEVNDPPQVSASLIPICGEDDEGLFTVQFSATDDTDPNPTVTAELNGIPVDNGQRVELELDDENGSELEDGILEIEASSFSLDVTAIDDGGLTATVSVVPSFSDFVEECEEEDEENDD